MTRVSTAKALAVLVALVLGWQATVFAQTTMELQVTPTSAQIEAIELSLDILDAMEQVTFSTTTIWTDDEVTFSGVPLQTLLASVKADGTTLEMVALNDYKIAMPIAEIEDNAPIIATRMNGETMSVRDKGPYWVVFPYDQDPKYQNETVYSYSIWQLNRLKVVD